MPTLYLKLQAASQLMGDERAQDLIEYALIGALIAVACTAAMGSLATAISTELTAIGTAL